MNRHSSRIGLFALSALSWHCTSSGMNPAATGGNGGTTSTGGHPSTGGAGGSATGGTGTGGTGTGGTGTGGAGTGGTGTGGTGGGGSGGGGSGGSVAATGGASAGGHAGSSATGGANGGAPGTGGGGGGTAGQPGIQPDGSFVTTCPNLFQSNTGGPAAVTPDAESRTGQLSAHRADGVHPLLAGHLRRDRAGQYGRQAYGLRADESDPGHGQRLGRRAQGGRLPSGDADDQAQHRILPVAVEVDQQLQSVLGRAIELDERRRRRREDVDRRHARERHAGGNVPGALGPALPELQDRLPGLPREPDDRAPDQLRPGLRDRVRRVQRARIERYAGDRRLVARVQAGATAPAAHPDLGWARGRPHGRGSQPAEFSRPAMDRQRERSRQPHDLELEPLELRDAGEWNPGRQRTFGAPGRRTFRIA